MRKTNKDGDRKKQSGGRSDYKSSRSFTRNKATRSTSGTSRFRKDDRGPVKRKTASSRDRDEGYTRERKPRAASEENYRKRSDRDDAPRSRERSRDDRPSRDREDRGERSSGPPKRSYSRDAGERTSGPRKSAGDRRKSYGRDDDRPSRRDDSDAPRRSYRRDDDDAPRKSYRSNDSDGPRKSYRKDDSDGPRKSYRRDDADGPRKSYRRDDSDGPRKSYRSDDSDGPRKSYRSNDSDTPRRSYRKTDSDGPSKPFYSRDDDSSERPAKRYDEPSGDRSERPWKREAPEGRERSTFRKKRDDAAEDHAPRKRESGRSGSDDDRPERRRSRSAEEPEKNEKAPSKPAKSTQSAGDGELIRLNKYLSNAGIASRREADTLIESGAVKVNGEVITQLGYKIRPTDKVTYGDSAVKGERKVYLLLNKPKDYITTMDDPRDRKTVMHLVEGACRERVYPVGRLDRNTSGVLLLTNDGELTAKLTHPKYGIKKIYHVSLDKNLKPDHFKALTEGIELEDGPAKADDLSFPGESRKEVGIEIHSGRNRLVRRMFESLGYEVIKLDRVVFAGLTKKDLPRGKYRFLSPKEVNFLKMLG